MSMLESIAILEKQVDIMANLITALHSTVADQHALIIRLAFGVRESSVSKFGLVNDGRCHGRNQTGERCKIPVSIDNLFCGTHERQDPEVLLETLKQMRS